ncbi:unnamed protein product [Leptosia nina]|uniref:Uncharacterized protein n=1 Tax=Leptosia nina TaxID=320188 RepID=A0AAV1JYY9_9NEOP
MQRPINARRQNSFILDTCRRWKTSSELKQLIQHASLNGRGVLRIRTYQLGDRCSWFQGCASCAGDLDTRPETAGCSAVRPVNVLGIRRRPAGMQRAPRDNKVSRSPSERRMMPVGHGQCRMAEC